MNDVLEVRAVRVAHALNALSVLGTFAAAILGHAGQPDRVPMHFDLAGVPNRWVDKSWGNTLAVPFLAVSITAFIYGSAQILGWARKHPKMLNMPDKEAVLALPSDLQDPIWRQMKATIYWVAVPVTLLFPTMVGLCPTKDGGIRVWPLFVLMGLMIVLFAVLVIRVSRAARRAVAAGTQRRLV